MHRVEGVMLDLSEMIIILVRGDYDLPAVRSSVDVLLVFPPFIKVIARGIARSKEKISLWKQVLPHTLEHGSLVAAREKQRKGVSQHINEGKVLLELERTGISDDPLHGDTVLACFVASPFDHRGTDIYARHLISLLCETKSYASRSTG